MKKSMKRVGALLLCLVMAAALLPTGAFAAKQSITTEYDLWVGGVRVTSKNKNGVTGDTIQGTVTFDPETDTLTLKNAVIVAKSGQENSVRGCGIYRGTEDMKDGKPLTIVFSGENTVVGAAATDYKGGLSSYGIYGKDDLTFRGEMGAVFHGAAVGTGAKRHSYGAYSEGRVTVESGTVNFTGGETVRYSTGIQSRKILVKGGTLKAVGTGRSEEYDGECWTAGVSTHELKVTGGTLEAIGNADSAISYGIHFYDPREVFSITGGTVIMDSAAGVASTNKPDCSKADKTVVLTSEQGRGIHEKYDYDPAKIEDYSYMKVTCTRYPTANFELAMENSGVGTESGKDGVTITGTVTSGTVTVGDTVNVVLTNGTTYKSLVGGIVSYGSALESAGTDTGRVSMWLPDVPKDKKSSITNGTVVRSAADYAAAMYDLWVGGTRVTRENLDDIPVKRGRASYDPATRTLFLEGAVIEGVSGSDSNCAAGISQSKGELTIQLSGSNTVYGMVYNKEESNAICGGGKVTITGGGSLTAKAAAASRTSLGIKAFDLIIEGGTINAVGARSSDGWSCGLYISEDLTITGGDVTATGGTGSASMGVYLNRHFRMEDGKAVLKGEGKALGRAPILGEYIVGEGSTSYGGSNAEPYSESKLSTYKYLALGPVPGYDVWVGGIELNQVNRSDLKGDTITGRVSYDPDTRTLTLTDADIKGVKDHEDSWGAGVYANGPLTLVLNGANKITGESCYSESIGVYCAGDLRIKGTGSLEAAGAASVGEDNTGIYTYGSYIQESGTVTARAGKSAGEWGGRSVGLSVSDDNMVMGGTLMASGYDQAMDVPPETEGYADAAVTAYSGWGFDGASVYYRPEKLEDYRAIRVGPAADEVPVFYNIYVGGVEVTPENMEDIKGPTITGKVSYDPVSRTMTLTDAVICGAEDDLDGQGNGIYTEDFLKLELVGENTILAPAWTGPWGTGSTGISCYGGMVVTGAGSLEVLCADGVDAASYAVWVEDGGYVQLDGTVILAAGTTAGVNDTMSVGLVAEGEIEVSGGVLVAKGHDMAMNEVPDVSEHEDGYVTVSRNVDGSDPEVSFYPYAMEEYRYVRAGAKEELKPEPEPEPKLTVTVGENGTVANDPGEPKTGETVTFTVTPDKDYETASVTAKDADGGAVHQPSGGI